MKENVKKQQKSEVKMFYEALQITILVFTAIANNLSIFTF
jgi:hypothetical protein